MTDPGGQDERAVRALMTRALDGEPELRLDLGDVRAAGRRRRRRARRTSWVSAAAVAAGVVVAVVGVTGTVPMVGAGREVRPAGQDPTVTSTQTRAPDQRTVAEQEAAGNTWRARAMEAVVGALAQQASAVPVQQLPLVEDVTDDDGRLVRRGYLVVDVVGVADDRAVREDLTITVQHRPAGAGAGPTGPGEPGGCVELRPACEQEQRADGTVLRWGSGVTDDGRAVAVAEREAGGTRVQVTSAGQTVDGRELPPALTVEQVRQVALAHVLTKPLP